MPDTPKKLAPRTPVVIRAEDGWGGIPAAALGTDIFLLYPAFETGQGPRWHVHPYDEVFVVLEGRALFTIGDTKVEAGPGDTLMGPANVPHKFRSVGPGVLRTVDIHLSPDWIQTDLPDPDEG